MFMICWILLGCDETSFTTVGFADGLNLKNNIKFFFYLFIISINLVIDLTLGN